MMTWQVDELLLDVMTDELHDQLHSELGLTPPTHATAPEGSLTVAPPLTLPGSWDLSKNGANQFFRSCA